MAIAIVALGCALGGVLIGLGIGGLCRASAMGDLVASRDRAVRVIERLCFGYHVWASDTDGIHEDTIPAFLAGLEAAAVSHTTYLDQHDDWVYRLDPGWLDRMRASEPLTGGEYGLSPHPHRDFDPDYRIPPGELLAEELEARGWTPSHFAALTGLPEATFLKLFLGHVPVTPEIAAVFERALGTTAQFWLNLEALYRKPVEVGR